jgi:hypothetical protein
MIEKVFVRTFDVEAEARGEVFFVARRFRPSLAARASRV